MHIQKKQYIQLAATNLDNKKYDGHIAIIHRDLYGLKSSGAAWQSLFASTLHDIGYISSFADPDVWMRPATKDNGEHYYEYMFVYVNDILVLSEQPSTTMNGSSDKSKNFTCQITHPNENGV